VAPVAVVTAASARALLADLVDYAGLFPPAALGMDAAVAEYARWRGAPEAFMLGRFVAPAARLVELGRAADTLLPEPGGGEPWRVSALVGADVHGDGARVSSWNVSHSGRAVVDTVELKAASAAEAEATLDALGPGLTVFVELPLDSELGAQLAALKRRGARAKLRTGGLVPEAVPEPGQIARFIVACAEAGVPFKATAGLHHPVRAEQALGYEPDSPRAMLHGFLNVFAAAAFAKLGSGASEVEAVLREQDPRAFVWEESGLAWRDRRLATDSIAAARRDFASSFGSCSFAEPVADLRAIEVLV
jgi:hypothetical protein